MTNRKTSSELQTSASRKTKRRRQEESEAIVCCFTLRAWPVRRHVAAPLFGAAVDRVAKSVAPSAPAAQTAQLARMRRHLAGREALRRRCAIWTQALPGGRRSRVGITAVETRPRGFAGRATVRGAGRRGAIFLSCHAFPRAADELPFNLTARRSACGDTAGRYESTRLLLGFVALFPASAWAGPTIPGTPRDAALGWSGFGQSGSVPWSIVVLLTRADPAAGTVAVHDAIRSFAGGIPFPAASAWEPRPPQRIRPCWGWRWC